jgi:hypothetical protein
MSQTLLNSITVPLQSGERSTCRTMIDDLIGLGVPHGREHSFKFVRGQVLGNRVLVGVPRSSIRCETVLAIGREFGMPMAAQHLLTARFKEANAVFFATEEDGPQWLFKIYLEFWDVVRARVIAGDITPQLLHLGVKWSSARPGHFEEAHYTCHPLLGVRDVLRRMGEVYPPEATSTASLAFAQDVVRMGVNRRRDAVFLYLEASEAGNPRRSFDVNLYKTGLAVADAAEGLRALAVQLGIAQESVSSVLAGMAALPLGHVAAGCDRRGDEFLSVYAEIAPLPVLEQGSWSER